MKDGSKTVHCRMVFKNDDLCDFKIRADFNRYDSQIRVNWYDEHKWMPTRYQVADAGRKEHSAAELAWSTRHPFDPEVSTLYIGGAWLVNFEKLLELADRFDSLPNEEFNQSKYKFDDGRPADIAGHAVALDYDISKVITMDVYRYARQILGLDKKQAFRLFHKVSFNYMKNPLVPSEAAKVLRNLVKTGEVNWGKAREGDSDLLLEFDY